MWWTYIISFLLWFNIFIGLHYEIYDHGEYKKGRRVKLPLILWILGFIVLIFPLVNIIIYSSALLVLAFFYFLGKSEGFDMVINPFPLFLLKRY